MDALQEQEMALAQERRRAAELGRIEAALKRIESGDYGYCLACDEPIAEKRLDNDPAATLCVACRAARGG
jgi:DnaK suppressor protein